MTPAGLLIGRREDLETGLLDSLVNGDVINNAFNTQGPPDVTQNDNVDNNVDNNASIKVERVSESVEEEDVDNNVDNVVTGPLSQVLSNEIDSGAAVNTVRFADLYGEYNDDDRATTPRHGTYTHPSPAYNEPETAEYEETADNVDDDNANDDNVGQAGRDVTNDNDFADDSDWENRPLRSTRHREPKKRCKDCNE